MTNRTPRWFGQGTACCLCLLVVSGFATTVAAADKLDVPALVAVIRSVKPMGTGHKAAADAMRSLAEADATHVTTVLAGMDGADLLVSNWLRGVVEGMVQRHLAAGKKLPIADLEKFLAETQHAPRARRVAYETIARVDAQAEARLIPGLINDPSLELRRDAVSLAMKAAAEQTAEGPRKAAYNRVLSHARDLDQVKEIAAELKKLGETADLATHFGFITSWKLVAPFNNVGGKGFNVAYPPESGVDLKATYEGKDAKIGWIEHTTTDEMGLVDLNKTLDKFKGAIAYAYTEFQSEQEREIEIRIGSDCATKIWLNGQLIASNEIYHANMVFDQYLGRGKLKAGKNQILVKVAQNEQTEAWAQDWKFQLRVCDSIGTAVLSQDRRGARTASLSLPIPRP
jgi:hypothetical protein